MTTVHFNQQRGGQLRRPRRRHASPLSLPSLIALAAMGFGALAYIGYVLWPRWPAPRLDAPPLPITVAGAVFNLPPAAIRVAAQRRPGAQQRVDLVFLWPSLEPPDPNAKPSAPAPGMLQESWERLTRVFMTITAAGDTLAPVDRALTIYPRYAAAEAQSGPNGLAVRAFRDDTPYEGEDLIYEPATAGFLVRCTRNRAGPARGICLYERRIEGADVVVRFPRDWLSDWRMVAVTLERLIASVRTLR